MNENHNQKQPKCADNESDETEETCTFDEYFEQQDRLSLDVLAGCEGDINSCTYPRGYVPRQAVFGCTTCSVGEKWGGGLCYACMRVCHATHDVFELGTKRKFRCDCGNAKFTKQQQTNSNKHSKEWGCALQPQKDEQNTQNLYNHNFANRFCVCDELQLCDESTELTANQTEAKSGDDKEEDKQKQPENNTMLQCFMCEDWLHRAHVTQFEDLGEEFDFCCADCAVKFPFLCFFARQFSTNASAPAKLCYWSDKHNEENENTEESEARALQLAANWRSALCACEACKRGLAEANALFLLDERDSLQHYYAASESLRHSQSSSLDQFAQQMIGEHTSHENKIFIAESIRDVKRTFENAFANLMNNIKDDPNHVITKEDIMEHFTKKLRPNNDQK